VIRATGEQLDWKRLIDRFGPHWRVLLAHLILFTFIYPSERSKVPFDVLDSLMKRARDEKDDEPDKINNGTIISRQQYLKDIEEWGYKDARLEDGLMSPKEIHRWTAGIEVDGTK